MWIRVDVATPDGKKAKRQQRRIAALGAPPVPADDPRVIMGTLVLLWIRTRVQAADGFLEGYTAEDLGIMIGCSDAEAQALIDGGWLDVVNGGLEVHEWMAHNGDHMREAKRKRDSRVAVSPRTENENGTEGPAFDFDSSSRPVPSRPVPSRGHPRTKPDVHRTSTGRPRTNPDGTADPLPATERPGPEPQGPQEATATRTLVFEAAGVPKDQWAAIDLYAGLSAADDSPEANSQRTALAVMDPDTREEILAPLMVPEEQGDHRTRRRPKPEPEPEAERAPVRRPTGIHHGAVMDIAKPLGKAGQVQAVQLATWLFNRGITHDGLLKRFLRHFVDHHAAIKEPHAYYNPGRDGFEFIRERCAEDHAIEEHETLMAAERHWLDGLAKD